MADGLRRLHCPSLLVLFFLLKKSHGKEIMERIPPFPQEKNCHCSILKEIHLAAQKGQKPTPLPSAYNIKCCVRKQKLAT
jgi:hypothetical protein